MTAIICITILAYCILGKDIKGLIEKIGDVDWKRKADEVMEWLKPYAIKVGIESTSKCNIKNNV